MSVLLTECKETLIESSQVIMSNEGGHTDRGQEKINVFHPCVVMMMSLEEQGCVQTGSFLFHCETEEE